MRKDRYQRLGENVAELPIPPGFTLGYPVAQESIQISELAREKLGQLVRVYDLHPADVVEYLIGAKWLESKFAIMALGVTKKNITDESPTTNDLLPLAAVRRILHWFENSPWAYVDEEFLSYCEDLLREFADDEGPYCDLGYLTEENWKSMRDGVHRQCKISD